MTDFYQIFALLYYDPANHRFINADVYASTDISSALASNMFAYCQNNPVINADPTGEILITTLILGGAALFGIGTAIYTGCKAREAGCDWADTLFYAIGTGLCTFLTIYSLGMTAYGVYYNYCTLNGMTPVTEVGKTSTVYPPNDGFASTPEVTTLEPGTQVDRFGGPNGRYVAPTGTSPEVLSLPPDKVGAAITRYTILEPIDTLSGTVAPWFGQPGGGTQYLLCHCKPSLVTAADHVIARLAEQAVAI